MWSRWLEFRNVVFVQHKMLVEMLLNVPDLFIHQNYFSYFQRTAWATILWSLIIQTYVISFSWSSPPKITVPEYDFWSINFLRVVTIEILSAL